MNCSSPPTPPTANDSDRMEQGRNSPLFFFLKYNIKIHKVEALRADLSFSTKLSGKSEEIAPGTVKMRELKNEKVKASEVNQPATEPRGRFDLKI